MSREAISYETVMREVQSFIAAKGRGTSKRLAAALGMEAPDFRHKLIGYRNERFTIEQIGQIAREADVGPGWPFVSRREAAVLAAIRDTAAGRMAH
jgi:hypothetical protein